MDGAVLNPLFSLEYAVLAVALLVSAAGFLAWNNAVRARRMVRIAVVVARILGVACVAVILLNPGRWKTQSEDQGREWALLVDRSASMGVSDVDGRARWDEANRLAQKAISFSTDPAKIKIYTFADGSEQVLPAELAGYKPDGKSTDIVRAGLDALSISRAAGRRLTGVLLLSDGRQIETGASREELGIRARAQESPIHTVALGGPVAEKDLIVQAPRTHYVGYVGQKIKIGVMIENSGMGKVTPLVELLDAKGDRVAEQKTDIEEGRKANVQFEITPKEKGYHEYIVRLPPWEAENRKNNNEAAVSVSVLEDKMRILVVEGVPYWDSKFLIQLLRHQPNTEVTSIYRLSADRFFQVETDPTKSIESSQVIFPDKRADLDKYDFVVFCRGIEYYLTPERISLLRAFVRERGGGVMFARGKPYAHPIPGLETLESVEWGDPLDVKFVMTPTSVGEDAGLFGDILPGRSDQIWAKLPSLQNAQGVRKVKPFANVLMEGSYDSGGKTISFPAVISRRYGKGLIVTVNAEGMWQWDFFPSIKEAGTIYKGFWMQLVQWIVTYSEFLPGQEYSLRLSQDTVLPEMPVRVRINRRFATEGDTSRPMLRVSRDKSVIQEVAMGRDADADNGWDHVVSFKDTGHYVLELGGIGDARSPRVVLTVEPNPAESDNMSADHEFMNEIAEVSGGVCVEEPGLEKLVRDMEVEAQTTDLSKAIWEPLWDKGWYLVLSLLFFAVEWFLRRRNGLM